MLGGLGRTPYSDDHFIILAFLSNKVYQKADYHLAGARGEVLSIYFHELINELGSTVFLRCECSLSVFPQTI